MPRGAKVCALATVGLGPCARTSLAEPGCLAGHKRAGQRCEDGFAVRDLWNVALRPPGQSALMPVNFTTLPHFSVSSAISFAKSAGEPGRVVAPNSASRAFILGSARPALISLLSLSTISVGVFLGAPTPNQGLASYPGTKSPTVGISGNASARVAAVTANGRSLPALMCSIDVIRVSNMT